MSQFEYTEIIGDGFEGWINLFFEGWCVAMVSDVELAARIKASTQEMNSVSDEQHEPHDDTCPVCLGEGFGPVGERPSAKCGTCGATGKL